LTAAAPPCAQLPPQLPGFLLGFSCHGQCSTQLLLAPLKLLCQGVSIVLLSPHTLAAAGRAERWLGCYTKLQLLLHAQLQPGIVSPLSLQLQLLPFKRLPQAAKRNKTPKPSSRIMQSLQPVFIDSRCTHGNYLPTPEELRPHYLVGLLQL